MASLDDLVSIDQVRAFVEPQGDRDLLLGDFITRASRLVRSFTRRRFTVPPFVGERRFHLQAGRYVYLDDPAAGIAYVRGEGSGAGTLGASLVEGEPASAVGSGVDLPYREPDPTDPEYLLRPRLVLDAPYTGPVVVSASFGWSRVPEDVQQAVLVTVGIWFERDVANTSTTFSLDERRTQSPEALPAQAKGILEPYRLQGAGIG
ncbi:MAG: head-tail connector protein [Actinomycetes bacterium]